MTKKTKRPEKFQTEVVAKILSEFGNGNVCFVDSNGINIQPLEWFSEQPIQGLLHDIGRDKDTICRDLNNTRWVNDLCMTTMLEHYYNRCSELEKKIKELGGNV